MIFPFPKIGPASGLQFPLDGEWLSGVDQAKIGVRNFSVLENMQYTDDGLEGVPGYSKINTTALTTNTNGRAGIHLRTPHTVTSSVVVEVEDSTGSGVIKENRTAIGSQGNFESTALFTETSGAGATRFSYAPKAQIAMANGIDECIWAGPEAPIAAFFLLDDLTLDGTEAPQDHTEKLLNTLQDANNVVTIDSAAHGSFLIFTTRPAKGFKFYVKTANGTNSTISAYKVYTGASNNVNQTGFADVTTPVDGTTASSKALAHTGTYSFDSTVTTAVKFHYQGLYLYAYAFTLSAGSAVIYHVTADLPFQQMVDVWDGVYREPIGCFVNVAGVENDYSAEVLVDSDDNLPAGAVLNNMSNAATDELVLVFEQQMAGFRFEFLSDKVNANAAVLTIGIWNGTNYSSNTRTSGTLNDETNVGGDTLAKSGMLTFVPLSQATESKRTERGVTGWCYKITVSAALSADVLIDRVFGIPASAPVRPHVFTSMYKNWLMLGCPTVLKESNRMDFCVANAPDSRNGEGSSDGGRYALYFGGGDPIVCADQVFQRFASAVVSLLAVFKAGEMHILQGDSVEDLKIYPVSFNVGCPAQHTLTVSEVGGDAQAAVNRNVLLWISHAGPMMFDTAVVYHIRGIENYFDPERPECVNYDYLHIAQAKFDVTRRQWNVLIPSGSGQTTNNVWLVLDLVRKKWFRKTPGSSQMPQCLIPVMATTGERHLYGMVDTGYLMFLGNGTSWDGHGIRQRWATGDFWPTENIWDQTRITTVKHVAHRTNEAVSVGVTHYANTLARAGSVYDFEDDYYTFEDNYYEFIDSAEEDLEFGLDSGSNRLVMDTQVINKSGNAHRIEFDVTTSETAKGYRPIAWGFEYVIERRNRESF